MTAYTTWGYTPTTTWYWDQTTIVTVTSLVPCPVTSYTTIYECQACGVTTPPPQPVCTVTCPIQSVYTYIAGIGYVTTTEAYYPGEIVVVTVGGQAVETPAAYCCAFTQGGAVVATPVTTNNGLSFANGEGRSSDSVRLDPCGLPCMVVLWLASALAAGAGMILL